MLFIGCNEKSVIYTDIPWHFKNTDNKEIDVNMELVKSESINRAEVSAIIQSFADEKQQITGKRICLFCGENTVFITDLIKSGEDVCVYTDFAVHNSDFSLSCNVAEKSKLVLRNRECGIKHFRLLSEIDGASVMDKAGLLMPYKTKEYGDVLYSMYEGLHSHGKEHLSCFGFCSDAADKVGRWHFCDTQRGYTAVLFPEKNGWEIQVSTDCVKIYKDLECKGVFSLN